MMREIFRLTVLLTGVSLGASNQTAAQIHFPNAGPDAIPNVALVQFTDGVFPIGKKSGLTLFDAIADSYEVSSIEHAFPYLEQNGVKCENLEKLLSIYRVHFSRDTPPELLALAFESDPGVVYAEAEYYSKTTGSINASIPNDPEFDYQTTYMDRLQLQEAWEIVKGEQGEVVVAILDSGTDWQHEDLLSNVWTNSDEIPDNGIDDDDNGYVDDVHGYDFGNGLPYTPGIRVDLEHNFHGTAVASVTSAQSNNAKGLTGSSWNATYMPLGADCGGGICYVPEAVLYAAANGADILNGSFASPNYQRTMHLAMQCAMEMGTLSVVGAGNDGTNNDVNAVFPASFSETLTVGGTERYRDRVVFNFGSTVDVYANGRDLALAFPNQEYGYQSGTSFASPLVAGIAALVKTRFPNFSAEQLREQIRYTAETIEPSNPPGFEGLLGRGRVNAYQAVRAPIANAVRVTGVENQNSADNASSSLIVGVESYFGNGANRPASVELANVPPYLGFESTSQNIDFSGGTGTVRVIFPYNPSENAPYRVRDQIEIQLISGEEAERVRYSLESRSGKTLPVYDATVQGLIGYSITSEGNFGYLDQWGSRGIGLRLINTDLGGQLIEAGLIMGTGPDQISSSITGHKKSNPNGSSAQPIHFSRKPGTTMNVSAPDENGAVTTQVMLLDSNAPNPIGVEILEETEFIVYEQHGGFIIVKYTIRNSLQIPIENLHVGLYADWILSTNWREDQPRFDHEREAIYQIGNMANRPSTVPGIKVLSENFDTRYGAVLNDGNYPGTWNEIMWRYLSEENRLGVPSNDIWSHIASVGPIQLEPEDQTEVVFAIVEGVSEFLFRDMVDNAVAYWKGFDNSGGHGYVQIINATSNSLDTRSENEKILTNIPPLSSSNYIPVNSGDRKISASISGDLNNTTTAVSNMEVVKDEFYQIIYSGTDQIQSTTACCARLHGSFINLRVSHHLPDHNSLNLRFVSDDQTWIQSVQIDRGAISSYIDLTPDEYILQISENGKPTKNIRIDFRNFDHQALLLAFVPQNAGPPAIAGFGHTEGERLFLLDLVETPAGATQSNLPPEFVLHGNYPNPVSHSTMQIHFDLPTSARVSLEVIDLLGKRIREFPAVEMRAGWGTSLTVDSRGLSSGTYLYRLTAQSSTGIFMDSGKFIVVR